MSATQCVMARTFSGRGLSPVVSGKSDDITLITQWLAPKEEKELKTQIKIIRAPCLF